MYPIFLPSSRPANVAVPYSERHPKCPTWPPFLRLGQMESTKFKPAPSTHGLRKIFPTPPVLRKLGSAPSAVGVSSGQWDLATIRASCQENHLPVTGSSPPGKRYTFSHDGPPVSTAVGPRPEPPTSKCQTQLGRRATAPQHEHPDLHDIRRADVLSWIRQTSIVLIWRHRQTDTRPRRTASIIRPSRIEHSGPRD